MISLASNIQIIINEYYKSIIITVYVRALQQYEENRLSIAIP